MEKERSDLQILLDEKNGIDRQISEVKGDIEYIWIYLKCRPSALKKSKSQYWQELEEKQVELKNLISRRTEVDVEMSKLKSGNNG